MQLFRDAQAQSRTQALRWCRFARPADGRSGYKVWMLWRLAYDTPRSSSMHTHMLVRQNLLLTSRLLHGERSKVLDDAFFRFG